MGVGKTGGQAGFLFLIGVFIVGKDGDQHTKYLIIDQEIVVTGS